jgi:DNA-directed RNA polymerase subunit M/transcription elongation factor TFIIS
MVIIMICPDCGSIMQIGKCDEHQNCGWVCIKCGHVKEARDERQPLKKNS